MQHIGNTLGTEALKSNPEGKWVQNCFDKIEVNGQCKFKCKYCDTICGTNVTRNRLHLLSKSCGYILSEDARCNPDPTVASAREQCQADMAMSFENNAVAVINGTPMGNFMKCEDCQGDMLVPSKRPASAQRFERRIHSCTEESWVWRCFEKIEKDGHCKYKCKFCPTTCGINITRNRSHLLGKSCNYLYSEAAGNNPDPLVRALRAQLQLGYVSSLFDGKLKANGDGAVPHVHPSDNGEYPKSSEDMSQLQAHHSPTQETLHQAGSHPLLTVDPVMFLQRKHSGFDGQSPASDQRKGVCSESKWVWDCFDKIEVDGQCKYQCKYCSAKCGINITRNRSHVLGKSCNYLFSEDASNNPDPGVKALRTQMLQDGMSSSTSQNSGSSYCLKRPVPEALSKVEQEDLERDLAKLFCILKLPLELVNHPALQKYLKKLCPAFQPPNEQRLINLLTNNLTCSSFAPKMPQIPGMPGAGVLPGGDHDVATVIVSTPLNGRPAMSSALPLGCTIPEAPPLIMTTGEAAGKDELGNPSEGAAVPTIPLASTADVMMGSPGQPWRIILIDNLSRDKVAVSVRSPWIFLLGDRKQALPAPPVELVLTNHAKRAPLVQGAASAAPAAAGSWIADELIKQLERHNLLDSMAAIVSNAPLCEVQMDNFLTALEQQFMSLANKQQAGVASIVAGSSAEPSPSLSSSVSSLSPSPSPAPPPVVFGCFCARLNNVLRGWCSLQDVANLLVQAEGVTSFFDLNTSARSLLEEECCRLEVKIELQWDIDSRYVGVYQMLAGLQTLSSALRGAVARLEAGQLTEQAVDVKAIIMKESFWQDIELLKELVKPVTHAYQELRAPGMTLADAYFRMQDVDAKLKAILFKQLNSNTATAAPSLAPASPALASAPVPAPSSPMQLQPQPPQSSAASLPPPAAVVASPPPASPASDLAKCLESSALEIWNSATQGLKHPIFALAAALDPQYRLDTRFPLPPVERLRAEEYLGELWLKRLHGSEAGLAPLVQQFRWWLSLTQQQLAARLEMCAGAAGGASLPLAGLLSALASSGCHGMAGVQSWVGVMQGSWPEFSQVMQFVLSLPPSVPASERSLQKA